jgi:DNA-directed RNA polymerase specialized sigma24 family protein
MSELQKNSQLEEIIKYLKANLLLQLHKLGGDQNENVKLEVLLNQAGFSYQEIADLLDKNYNAVKMAILRSKKNDKDNDS